MSNNYDYVASGLATINSNNNTNNTDSNIKGVTGGENVNRKVDSSLVASNNTTSRHLFYRKDAARTREDLSTVQGTALCSEDAPYRSDPTSHGGQSEEKTSDPRASETL